MPARVYISVYSQERERGGDGQVVLWRDRSWDMEHGSIIGSIPYWVVLNVDTL